jgi:phospholipid transport system substrate-binding protein
MNTVKRRSPVSFLAPLFGGFALLYSTSAFAGPATDLVKDKQSAIFQILQSGTPDEKKIGSIFDEMLDYSALAQASLGEQWGTLKPAQQAEFTGLLKQLVQQAYERNLKKTLDFNIEYTHEEPAGSGATVFTKATSKADKREDPIEISYALEKSGAGFKIVDIVTDDVSLVSSYRGQFVKTIKADGYDGLVRKMKDKISKGS